MPEITPETPRQMIEALVADLPDELIGPSRDRPATKEEAARRLAALFDPGWATGLPIERLGLTRRDQARALLSDMAGTLLATWDGYSAIRTLLALHRREVLPGELDPARFAAARAYPLAARIWRRLIAPEIAVVQAFPRAAREGEEPTSPVFHLALPSEASSAGSPGQPALAAVPLQKFQMSSATSAEWEARERTACEEEFLPRSLVLLADEVAERLNLRMLTSLAEAAPRTSLREAAARSVLVHRALGQPTLRVLGSGAASALFRDRSLSLSDACPGVVRIADRRLPTYVATGWEGALAGCELLLRAEPCRSLAPLAYAPHLMTLTALASGDGTVIAHHFSHVAGYQVVEPRLLLRIDH